MTLPVEVRKRRHGPLRGASDPAPRGSGNTRQELCELPKSSARTFESDPETVLRSTAALGHLEKDENDLDPFFTPKMRKMEHAGGDPGDPGEAGAPEMQPRAAACGHVLHAPGARIT